MVVVQETEILREMTVKHVGIEYRNADIANVEADVIVNAANTKGYMGGWLGRYVRLRGVAESLNYATRGAIEKEARSRIRGLKFGLGDVYVTDAYNLPAHKIVHAVTMIRPGMRSNIEVVRKCLDSVVTMCREVGAQTVAIPLLGTGTGRVAVDDVLDLYKDVLGTIADMKFVIVRRSFVERE